jgi:hypothetical protein
MSDDDAIVPESSHGFIFPLGMDDYQDIQLSESAKSKLANILIGSRAGLVSSAPLICRGPVDCPFKSRCPIFMADGQSASYPINRQCIVELNFVQDRFMAYADELDVQGKVADSMTYRSQISALVDLDLREFRTNLILAGVGGFSDGTMLHEQTIAMSEDGEEVNQLQEHPAWKNLVRIRKDRMDLLDAMGLTVKRDAMIRAALHQKEADNFLTRSIELLERIADLEEAMVEDK